MSITSTLQDTKNRLDGLLEYANETTGQSDVSIGDAIKTLADGFGGGGGGGSVITGTLTVDNNSRLIIPLDIRGKLASVVAYKHDLTKSSLNNYAVIATLNAISLPTIDDLTATDVVGGAVVIRSANLSQSVRFQTKSRSATSVSGDNKYYIGADSFAFCGGSYGLFATGEVVDYRVYLSDY